MGFEEPVEVWGWHFDGKNSKKQSRSLLSQPGQIITLKNEYNSIPFEKFCTLQCLQVFIHSTFSITLSASTWVIFSYHLFKTWYVVDLVINFSYQFCYQFSILAIGITWQALLNKCLMLPFSPTIALATKHSVQALGTKCVLQN